MNYPGLYENLLQLHAFLPFNLGQGRALSPLRVQVEVTGRCNLNCAFCYQGKSYKAGKDELSFKELIRIIEQIPRYSLITFTGGEPFLNERMHEILDYALGKRFCNIITNGTLLSEHTSRLLSDKRLLLLNVSIDGIQGTHDKLRGVDGVFDRVKDNILFLKEYKRKTKSKFPLVDVKTLINKENIPELPELYQFCQDIGADFFTLSLMKSNDIQFNGAILYDNLSNERFYKNYPANNNFDAQLLIEKLKLLDRMQDRVRIRYYPRFKDYALIEDYLKTSGKGPGIYYEPCYEPWSGFQINAGGKAYPCLAFKVGDIKTQSLREIWNSQGFVDFRNKLKQVKLFPGCAGCCYLKIRRKK